MKGEARYEGVEWIVTARGVSLLVGALATAECRVEEVIERHSHAVVIGEPLAISATSDGDALTYWRSAYQSVRQGVRLAAE